MLTHKLQVGIVGMVLSQSQILQHEIFSVQRIDQRRSLMADLKCICFIRPSKVNVSILELS